jgi:tRNA (guanine-N7-)-methyltransferase
MYSPNTIPETPKFFGRRKGRVVRKAKSFLLETLLPQMRVSAEKPFDVQSFGADKKEICLEIGFGDGQHLYGLAKCHPENGYLGVEVFQNGVANLLNLMSGIKEGDHLPESVQLEDCAVQNIRVFDDDVRLLFAQLPDASFDRVFLLFPDPWPKKKHASRRFVNPKNLKEIARILKPNGQFLVATDHPIYKRHVLRTMHGEALFEWTARCGNDWRYEPEDWVKTKYQQKALREGRRPVWFDYRRK